MKLRLLILVLILIAVLTPAYSYAVSSTDLPDFTASEAVPADVDIPEFYTRVENSSGLYIFMTADGTVHKRIYGNVDGVYGWYIAHGVDNTVLSAVPDADIDADRELYTASPWVYTGPTRTTTHVGLLPPVPGVESVDTVFGHDSGDVFKALGGGTVIICVIILIAASRSRGKSKH